MSEGSAKEYSLICPHFGTDGLCLDHDTQARCLQYIARHINTIAAMPPGAVLEVISLRWHHFGEAYSSLGIRALAALSATETVTWAEIAQEKSP